MTRIRIVGLSLLAVFAVSAAFVSSASAAMMPEYKVCTKAVPKESGKWNTKTCTGESKGGKKEGGYELTAWNTGKKTSFKGTNGKSTLYSYIKGFGVVGTVTCAKAKNVGQITGPDSGEVVVTFEKCTSSGETCTSAGAPKAGDIVTFKLNTLNILVNPTEVATRVEGAGPGGKSAEFKCGAEEISTTGNADGELKGDVNVVSKSSSQVFAVNAGGEQVINAEEGGTEGEDTLDTTVVGVGAFNSGEETTSALKGEAMEVEAP